MENALKAKPFEVKELYEKQIKDLQEDYGQAMLELRARKSGSPYYKPTKAAPKVNVAYVKPIKAMVEENTGFDHRTEAYFLNMNTTVKGWV